MNENHDSLPSDAAIARLEKCPLCGGASFRKLPQPIRWIGEDVFAPYRKELGLVRCRSCSLVFVNPRPNQTLLNMFYRGPDYSCHEHVQSLASQQGAGRFIHGLLCKHSYFSPGRSLLDYGCGGGFFIRAMKELGWQASGFDIGDRALESCRAHGLDVTNAREELKQRQFDAITVLHVFEHVADQGELLSWLGSLLKKDGTLLIEVPNIASLRARLSTPFLVRHCRFDERYRAFPIHLFHFYRETLVATLQKHGFDVRAVVTAGLGLENLISRTEKLTPSISAAADGGLTREHKSPLWKRSVKRVFVGSGLGDNLLVIASPTG